MDVRGRRVTTGRWKGAGQPMVIITIRPGRGKGKRRRQMRAEEEKREATLGVRLQQEVRQHFIRQPYYEWKGIT